MRKPFVVLGLSALLTWPCTMNVQAQGPAREGPPMRGSAGSGSAGNRSMRSNRMRSKMQLTRLWRGIGQLEKSKNSLTKSQAAKIVTIVRPWRTKPQMTDSQALSLHDQISSILTTQQKNELQTTAAARRKKMEDWRGANKGPGQNARGERRGAQRPGTPGAGRAGAGRPGAGKRGGFDREKMQQITEFTRTVNPFYAPTGYKEFKSMPPLMQQGFTRRHRNMDSILVALSKKSG